MYALCIIARAKPNSSSRRIKKLVEKILHKTKKDVFLWGEKGRLKRQTLTLGRVGDIASRFEFMEKNVFDLAFRALHIISKSLYLMFSHTSIHSPAALSSILNGIDYSCTSTSTVLLMWAISRTLRSWVASHTEDFSTIPNSFLAVTIEFCSVVESSAPNEGAIVNCAYKECIAYLRMHFARRCAFVELTQLFATLMLPFDNRVECTGQNWNRCPNKIDVAIADSIETALCPKYSVEVPLRKWAQYSGSDAIANGIRSICQRIVHNILAVHDGFQLNRTLALGSSPRARTKLTRASIDRPWTGTRPRRPLSRCADSLCGRSLVLLASMPSMLTTHGNVAKICQDMIELHVLKHSDDALNLHHWARSFKNNLDVRWLQECADAMESI